MYMQIVPRSRASDVRLSAFRAGVGMRGLGAGMTDALKRQLLAIGPWRGGNLDAQPTAQVYAIKVANGLTYDDLAQVFTWFTPDQLRMHMTRYGYGDLTLADSLGDSYLPATDTMGDDNPLSALLQNKWLLAALAVGAGFLLLQANRPRRSRGRVRARRGRTARRRARR